MRYTYTDDFIVNSLGPDELEGYETQAIGEVDKTGITDPFYVENLVICRTMMLAARAQIEADGMAEKYKVYSSEYDRYRKEAAASASGGSTSAPESISVAKVVRG